MTFNTQDMNPRNEVYVKLDYQDRIRDRDYRLVDIHRDIDERYDRYDVICIQYILLYFILDILERHARAMG